MSPFPDPKRQRTSSDEAIPSGEDTLVNDIDGTVISGDTVYAEEAADDSDSESCLGREAYAEKRLHEEVMASLKRQTCRRVNQVLGTHDCPRCEVTVGVEKGSLVAATWEREEQCQRCFRIPADRTLFRQVTEERSVMICSVCRFLDACQTAWRTEHFDPGVEKDVERRLSELLESMLWPRA